MQDGLAHPVSQKLCRRYARTGRCRYGDQCLFRHSGNCENTVEHINHTPAAASPRSSPPAFTQISVHCSATEEFALSHTIPFFPTSLRKGSDDNDENGDLSECTATPSCEAASNIVWSSPSTSTPKSLRQLQNRLCGSLGQMLSRGTTSGETFAELLRSMRWMSPTADTLFD